MSQPDLRFVILHHRVGGSLLRTDQSHWDWMFGQSDAPELITFATAVMPSIGMDFEVATERLPDHRGVYLDYEGEISGNRGVVRRITAGTFRVLESSSDRFRVSITGRRPKESVSADQRTVVGEADFVCDKRSGWTLRFSCGRNETNL